MPRRTVIPIKPALQMQVSEGEQTESTLRCHLGKEPLHHHEALALPPVPGSLQVSLLSPAPPQALPPLQAMKQAQDMALKTSEFTLQQNSPNESHHASSHSAVDAGCQISQTILGAWLASLSAWHCKSSMWRNV